MQSDRHLMAVKIHH